MPWCDSRNRASQYQIEAASWQRRADRMRAESKTDKDEERMQAAWRKRERGKKRGQSDQAWPKKKDNQILPI